MLKYENTTLTLRRAVTMLVAVTFVTLSPVALAAQAPYYQPQNNDRSLRSGRALPANPFPTVVESPPVRQQAIQNDSARYAGLTKTFAAAGSPVAAAGSPLRSRGGIQDLFGENPVRDAFGEGARQSAAGNPFEKVAPPSRPRGKTGTFQTDDNPKSPFSLLPTESLPETPPMDTRPSVRRGNRPQLPSGFEYTPNNPSSIPSNPPIPGQEDEVPRIIDDPVQVPDTRDTDDPGEITSEDASRGDDGGSDRDGSDRDGSDDGSDEDSSDDSIFDRVDPPSDDDLPPVPAPASSRVYLPANTPSDYENPLSKDGDAIHRGYNRRDPRDPRQKYDPRYAGQNPYAGLPGPYGFAAPPQGYPPYPMPYMLPPMGPYGYGYGYGHGFGQYAQCGPGCTPIGGQCGPGCKPIGEDENRCGLLCDPCTISKSGGCNRGSSCSNDSRPMLPQTDFGDRILDTGLVDSCGCDDTYTEVIGECDDFCSNYASAYVSLFGGWSSVSDFVTEDENGRGVYFDDSGSVFGFAIGQVQGRNLRTELELSYRNIGISGLRLEGDVPSEFLGVNGDFGTFSGMLNGYWEFVDVRFNKVKPYIGGGLGFAIARPELLQADGVEAVIDNSDSSFAYQWMVGLNYKASTTLDAFVEYRYFVADSFQLDTEIPLVSGLGNGSGQFDYQSSNVIFGMRARF